MSKEMLTLASIVIKLIGAASQKGWPFERCRKIGELGNSELVTIGTSLDHCHVPGREAFEQVPEDACVLGMGIHNEPVSQLPSMDSKKLTDRLGPPNNISHALCG